MSCDIWQRPSSHLHSADAGSMGSRQPGGLRDRNCSLGRQFSIVMVPRRRTGTPPLQLLSTQGPEDTTFFGGSRLGMSKSYCVKLAPSRRRHSVAPTAATLNRFVLSGRQVVASETSFHRQRCLLAASPPWLTRYTAACTSGCCSSRCKNSLNLEYESRWPACGGTGSKFQQLKGS